MVFDTLARILKGASPPSMKYDPMSLLILRFHGRSVAVVRAFCSDYEKVVTVARQNFRSLDQFPHQDLVLLASIPGYPDTNEVEIGRGAWLSLYTVLHTVTIALESEMHASADSECSSTVVHPGNNVRPAKNRRIPVAPTLHSDDDVFRKPVIYLYPPFRLPDVTVQLLLTSSWSFSAVYPSSQTAAQSLTWAVEAEPDGRLVEKTTGAEVTYLFWEATTNSHLVTPDASRATTPVEDIETFDPCRPSLNPGDSVLLPIGKIPGYLDVALKALTLHTEARTSFITYWLPTLLKYEYVALRFVAQAAYEKAAQMRVSPAPDVVTRVFMLFRGVRPDDVGPWAQAAARATAEDGATFWTGVVGVDAVRASDRTLFRVLEWGGMEVGSCRDRSPLICKSTHSA